MKPLVIISCAILILFGLAAGFDALTVQAGTAKAEAQAHGLATSGSPSLNYKIVRTEYLDINGNLPHTDTTCHIINTSYTTPVVLTTVYFLEHQGLAGPGVSHTALIGTVIPPLGRLNFKVNSSIPGIFPQTGYNADTIVASVVVGWSGGSDETVELSATIERYATGQTDMRAHIQVDGHSITP